MSSPPDQMQSLPTEDFLGTVLTLYRVFMQNLYQIVSGGAIKPRTTRPVMFVHLQ